MFCFRPIVPLFFADKDFRRERLDGFVLGHAVAQWPRALRCEDYPWMAAPANKVARPTMFINALPGRHSCRREHAAISEDENVLCRRRGESRRELARLHRRNHGKTEPAELFLKRSAVTDVLGEAEAHLD